MDKRHHQLARSGAIAALACLHLTGCTSFPAADDSTGGAGRERSEDSGGVTDPDSEGRPASRTLIEKSRALRAAGMYELAGNSVEQAVRIDSNNPSVWLEMGRVRLAVGDFKTAETLGRKAVTLAAGDSAVANAAWGLVAEALHRQGRAIEASEVESRLQSMSDQ